MSPKFQKRSELKLEGRIIPGAERRGTRSVSRIIPEAKRSGIMKASRNLLVELAHERSEWG